ncbi:MAG: nuclear transport factor 2 family protein [Alphaproteobacteria bacterium]|nr:nuclear transport factor 2 family protein [Alphaproteobacteria bacterium]
MAQPKSLSLAEQIDRLASIEAIKQLKARYCAACDDHYAADAIVALFTEDAVWDAGEAFGTYRGREAIRAFFAGISGTITFAAHLILNPIIEVDGDQATGTFRLIMPCTMVADGKPEARWMVSSYDNRFVRRDGVWLFQHLRVTVNINAPHLKGWA